MYTCMQDINCMYINMQHASNNNLSICIVHIETLEDCKQTADLKIHKFLEQCDPNKNSDTN